MSEATDRTTDDDAWARACAEDLAAEKERLRAERGAAGDDGSRGGTGTAAEELFKLFEAVADKVSALNNPCSAPRRRARYASSSTRPRPPSSPWSNATPRSSTTSRPCGSELLAAYRSAVEGHERRWTQQRPTAPHAEDDPRRDGDDGDTGPGPTERIDLD